MAFWIVTDACSDLPVHYIKKQHDLYIVPMSYQIDGVVKEIDLTDETLAGRVKSFYDQLSDGKVATTFQVNQNEWVDHIEPLLKAGHDVLMLVLSSNLSGMYATSKLAETELRAKYPERKLYTFDTRCASLGEGLLVHMALAYRDAGHTIEETFQYVQDTAPRVIHWLTVSDLHFLARGGRLSATSASLGSILKIKPVLNVDPNGRLVPRMKVQGRKHSLKALFEKVENTALSPETQTMFISHGDSEKDAHWLAERLQEKLHVPEVLVSQIGPIVGSHAGPGTVAVFFLDKDGSARLDAVEHH
jgi:DegV family protein with EDD domain